VIAARRASAPAIIQERNDESADTLADEATIRRATASALENAESMARSEIEDHINALGPYEFQDLVAALLRGMVITLRSSRHRAKMAVSISLPIAIRWAV
jgi:hypothetical protein